MTRDELIEYIVREARVAAIQMLDKSESIHIFDFGVLREFPEQTFSMMMALGPTKTIEAWAMLMSDDRNIRPKDIRE